MNTKLRQEITESLHKDPHSPGVHQGSRKLKHGLPLKKVVFFPSLKNHLLMPCESKLEADHCLQLEFDDSIECYRTQPLTFDIGNQQSYTPDCLLQTFDGDLFCREIKVYEKLKTPTLQQRIGRIRLLLANAGIGFEIVTEKQICVYPDIFNKKLLYKAKRERYTSFQIEQAKTLLGSRHNSLSLFRARQICTAEGLPSLIVDQMLSNGILGFDQKKNLSAESLVFVQGGS